jgi:hypothetical protein
MDIEVLLLIESHIHSTIKSHKTQEEGQWEALIYGLH